MTYTYVRAVALPYGANAQWQAPDLEDSIVATIYSTYREIALVLNRDGAEIFVDFNQLRTQYASYNNTLRVLLVSIGNRDLTTLDKLPGGKVDYIVYSDAYRIGYTLNLAAKGMNYPDDYPRDDLHDLVITRQGYTTNLSLLHDYCLVSINGYYHMTTTDGTQAWVVDGGRSVKKLNQGHAGLTSFMNLGKLTKLPFDPAQLQASLPEKTLKDGIDFTIPEDVTGKTFFMVLGGYLVFPDSDVFFQTSPTSYHLAFQRLPYLERLYESQASLDLSSLGLTVSELNPDLINIDEVYSDRVIRNYFGLSQSFFVILDRADVFIDEITLKPMQIPGLFTAYQEPKLPLRCGFGRTAEYWKIDEGRYWSVNVMDNYLRNFMFNKIPGGSLVNVTGQLYMERPYFFSQGKLLNIGAYASA